MTTQFRANAASLTCNPPAFACLPELPPSRWRSLGKRLDYTYWADRDRFLELDAAIVASKEQQGTDNSHSAEGESEQPDRTEEDADGHLNPHDLEILLKQVASAARDLRPAA